MAQLDKAARGHTHSGRIAALEGHYTTLLADAAETREAVARIERQAATKADIDSAINGVLRDALMSVPEHTANILAAQSNQIAASAQRTARIGMGWIAVGAVAAALSGAWSFLIHR